MYGKRRLIGVVVLFALVAKVAVPFLLASVVFVVILIPTSHMKID